MPSALLIIFSLLALQLYGCTSNPVPEQTAAQPIKKVAPLPAFTMPAAEITLHGYLSLYEGRGRFQSCNGEALYWFEQHEKITAIYNSIIKQPGNPVYIEFIGDLIKTPTEFADQFDAQAVPLKLLHMSHPRNTLGCQRQHSSSVKAFGLHDEWRAELTADRIKLASPRESWDKPVNRAYVEVGNERVWEGFGASDYPVIFKVTKKDCRNKNNNAYWAFSSSYISDIEHLGCADVASVDTQADFSGHYSGTLPVNGQDIEFNMSLHPDYSVSASLVYSQDNDSIEQTGFWKPISDTQLAVTLVKKNNPDFINEFVLNWNGEKISTQQQGLGGTTYPLAGKGLEMWLMDSAYVQGATAMEQRSFAPQNLPFNRQASRKVETALLNYFKIHRTSPHGMKYNYNEFDLNGDGKPELLVLLNWCSKQGCTLLVFENRGNDYRFVSRTANIHNALLLATGVDHQWQRLLARRGKAYVSLQYDGIGYPSSSKNQPIVTAPLPLAGITLFSEPEPPVWYHALPK